MVRKLVLLLAAGLMLAFVGGVGAQELSQGKVLFEYWFGGGVDGDLDNLKAAADFPDNPAESEWRDGMDRPDYANVDYFGVRARAFLTPPGTGDYTFWIASDDDSELWLSTDADPANAAMICSVEGWTGYQNWIGDGGDPGPNRQSAPVTLTAGETYYIEMLFSDGTGGGHGEVAWAGPEVGEEPTPLAGDMLTPLIRDPEPLFQATNPDPADGEQNLIMPLFSWTPGITAEMHDVYFGETAELGAAEFKGRQQAAMYFHVFPPLVPGNTYYWRVDEVDAVGSVYEGTVWSFRAMPVAATEPNPADGASNAPTAIEASWAAGQGALTHDVYGGTDPEALDLLATVETPSFALEGLETDTTYYWRVDENDAAGVTHVGDVWSFSTVPVIEGVDDPNLVGWWTFDTETAGSMAALDMSGNGNHGTLVGALSFATDADMGQVLDLPGGDNQFVNIGAVGIDGNDPTTIGCWAKADNTSIPDWTLIFGFTGNADGAGGNGSHFNIGSLGGPGGVGAHCWGWEETIFSDQEALEWHHYAMTYDGTTIAYYGDTMPVDTDPAKSNVQDLAARGDRVHIGSRVTQGSSFPGLVDDCRIYNYALTAEEVRQIFGNPLQAYNPQPADGVLTDAGQTSAVTWTPGDEAVEHDVYLGTDEALVAAADASVYQGRVAEAMFAVSADWAGNTIYWRIDEVNADGSITAGKVWSLTLADFLLVQLDEVTLNYDNTVEPFVSELALDVPADMTTGGVSVLSLRFIGGAAEEGGVAIDEATGTYLVSGSGADIWGNSDQFHYAYMQLTGDGEISARVVDNGEGTNGWAKGGVMIRETFATDSKHMIMALTGGEGGGIAFQGRQTTGAASSGFHGDVTASPPHWVKITREGNTITGYASADGVEWTPFTDASPDNSGGEMSNPIDVEMADPVNIGLFVTSHQSGEVRTFTFDNVNVVGDVSGMANRDIGLGTSTGEPIYMALEDAAGNVATVVHPNPEATLINEWDLWQVPLSVFEGVDVTAAAKLYVGVGDGEPGGYGQIRVADVRVVESAMEPAADAMDVTAPNDVTVGEPNDGDWPEAEVPAQCIDDDAGTKYLHFKGSDEPTGIRVTPVVGATVVTGVSFTTANDSPERDPVGFELYGSNESIDGPWTLIAAGTCEDFDRPIAWPRFKKNATPLGFVNTMAYEHYQLMVTEVRDPGAANSMQVAEVELLGVVVAPTQIIASVVRSNGVSDDRDPIGAYDGTTAPLATEEGGLMDGAAVFSDRTYPWAGIPAEYVGSEYIRTFNSDKNGGTDPAYEVTTSATAIVWVTVDDRIPEEWDADGTILSQQDAVDAVTAAFAAAGTFVDTGIDIYVREKDDGSKDRPMSVFAAELPAGTYVFGRMDSGKNFYTIGAIPAQ